MRIGKVLLIEHGPCCKANISFGSDKLMFFYIAEVNCSHSEPAEAPSGGTRVWDGSSDYGAVIRYECPDGKLMKVNFHVIEEEP